MQVQTQPKPTTKLNHRLGLTVVLAGLLLLTSCYRITSDVSVNNDGSGRVGYVLAFNYDAFASLNESEDPTLDGSGLGSREEFCDEAVNQQEDIPAAAIVEEYDEDGYCGIQVTVDIPANDDFASALAEATEGDDSANDIQDFEITKIADDQWSFFLSFDGTDLDGLESSPSDGSLEAEQAQILEDTLQIRYSVELPGEPVTHNADSAISSNGKTLFEWDVKPFESIESLVAETEPGDGSNATGSTTTTEPGDQPEPDDADTTLGTETDTDDAPNTDDASNGETNDGDSGTNEDAADDEETEEEAEDDEGVERVPFGDSPDPAVTSSGPATTILLLGLFTILVILGAIVALLFKWPSKTAAATSGPGGAHPGFQTPPPNNPLAATPEPFGTPSNNPPTTAPDSLGASPYHPPTATPDPFGGPPQSGPPPATPPSATPPPTQPDWDAATGDDWGGLPPLGGDSPTQEYPNQD